MESGARGVGVVQGEGREKIEEWMMMTMGKKVESGARHNCKGGYGACRVKVVIRDRIKEMII